MAGQHDLTGRQFGNLTVAKLDHIAASGHYMWECQCCCGNTIVARGAWLKKGLTVSCGCPLIKKEKEPVAISVGQKVRFELFGEMKGFDMGCLRETVTGTVVMVNEPHQWFSVECGDPKMLTSFKFCDVGSVVTVCG